MTEFLELKRCGAVLEIVLNRPKANTLDAALSREMSQVFIEFRDDPSLRVAILTGAGERFFSAGWDLNAVAEGQAYLDDFGEGGFGGFPELPNLYKPVICAVNGIAAGAGFEMLLRADFIVAADHASFLLPEVRIGMAPDVATFMLPKLLPKQLANQVLMTGQPITPERLEQAGIVYKVVPLAELMDCARALANDLIKAAPLSLAAVKEGIMRTEKLNFEESYAALRSQTWPNFMAMLNSSDAQEGAKAFLEGREPEWTGE